MILSNEILWLTFLVCDMSIVLLMYYFWGRIGLFSSVTFSLIIANIQVIKLIDLFGLTTTLGNILYASAFLSTDILSEFYSKKDAQKAVFLGFITLVLSTLYMQVALLYTPNISDTSQVHLEQLFSFFPRLTIASLTAYMLSQITDVWLYHTIRHITQTRFLWLRNTASTLTSQFLDTIVFTFIAFWGVHPMHILIELIVTTYIFKAIISIADTPFMYIARFIHMRREAISYNDVNRYSMHEELE